MRMFQPKFIDYQEPASLDIISNTFNTLEQGHREALANASNLKTALAQLDLNEAEDEWRTNKLKEIDAAISNNLEHGNAYYALDDIIKKQGDITSDPGLIGRIRAQQDYKTYLNNLEANTTLTEDTKNYYRTINKYNYNDIKDKDGNVIGGTKWTPTEREVNTIPLSDAIYKGIQIAAKEQGGSNVVRFIDKNGNITTNPMEAVDGEYFDNTTQEFVRLTKDKIKDGIKSFIYSDPNLLASIRQDMKVAKWKYNTTGIDNNYLDPNGVPMNEAQYIDSIIDPAARAASFYNTSKSVTYGNGLATYKRALANSTTIPDNYVRNNFSGYGLPVELEVDYGADLIEQKQNALNTLMSNYKTITGESLDISKYKTSTDIQNALTAAIEKAKALGYDSKTLAELSYTNTLALRDYSESMSNYESIKDNLPTEDDKDMYDTINRIKNGGNLDTTNKYDKQISDKLNKIFENTDYIDITLTGKNSEPNYNTVVNSLKGGTEDGFNKLGLQTGTNSNGRKYIRIPASKNNLVYLVGNTLKNTGVDFQITNDKGENNTSSEINELNALYPIMNSYSPSSKPNEIYNNMILNLTNTVNDYDNRVSKKLKNAGINKNTVYDNKLLEYQTYTEAKLAQDKANKLITSTEYKDEIKQIKENQKNIIQNTRFPDVEIYAVQDKKGVGNATRVVDSRERMDIGNLIKAAAAENKLHYTNTYIQGVGPATSFTVNYGLDGKNKPIPEATYVIPKLILEPDAEIFAKTSYNVTADKLINGNKFKTNFVYVDPSENSYMGSQSIQCIGNNQFVYNNSGKETLLDINSAVNLAIKLNEINEIRDSFNSGYIFSNIQSDEDLNSIFERLDSSLTLIKDDLTPIIGQNDAISLINSVKMDLNNSLK